MKYLKLFESGNELEITYLMYERKKRSFEDGYYEDVISMYIDGELFFHSFGEILGHDPNTEAIRGIKMAFDYVNKIYTEQTIIIKDENTIKEICSEKKNLQNILIIY